MEQTINNIENYNYVINILEISAIIEKVGGDSKGMRAGWTGNYDPICSGLNMQKLHEFFLKFMNLGSETGV